MFNWLGKVRLGKVLLSYNYDYCQRTNTLSQGTLKLNCADCNAKRLIKMSKTETNKNVTIFILSEKYVNEPAVEERKEGL